MITLTVILAVLIVVGLAWLITGSLRVGAEADERADETFRRMKDGR